MSSCLGATNKFLKLLSILPVNKASLIFAAAPGSGDGSAVDDVLSRQPDKDRDRILRTDADNEQAAIQDRRDYSDLQRDFDALMERYEKRIYNIVLQHIGDPDDASDITVETFVNAYRHRESFRGESRFYTWLYRIAINVSKNHHKSKARARTHEGPSLDAGFESHDGEGGGDLLESSLVADWSQSPELLIEKGELMRKIREAIDALPHEYRSVLILRELEDMNYNDIAEATGLTLEAVKTRILRARGMVRRKLAPYYSPQ